MNTYQSVCSTLKTSLRDASLSEKSYYGEQQLKPALFSFLNRLEAIGHKVCGDFNSFGLLCALQHYVPSPIMLPQQGFEPDAQVTFNNAATFAFRFSSATKDAKIKLTPADYRKLKSNDLSWVHTYSKVIEEVYSIVSVIEHTVRTLRCLGKGDEATIDFSSDDITTILQARPSEELEQKLRDYDERLLRTQNILIFYGLPIGVGKGESPLKGVTVNLNFAQYHEGHMDAPPVTKVLDMEGVYVATTLHSDEVIRIFNTRVHAEDLFVFLATLFKPQVEQAQQGERFPGLGYTFAQEQEIIDYVIGWAPSTYVDCFNQVFQEYRPGVIILECFTHRYWQEVVPKLLQFVSYDFASRESIDWHLFRPMRFAFKCDDGTVFLHLGSVIQFLAHLWDSFMPTGDFTSIKGRLFEKIALQILESIDGFTRIWDTGYKLNFPVGGKAGTDVDVFVRRKQLAFLISCKSYSTSRKYRLGDGQSAWERSEMAKSWLHSAQRVAKAIADHCEELNLNPEIRGIVSLVCTGWPEYLFEPSQDYFLEDGTPRIATLPEIQRFFKSIDDVKAERLSNDHWTVGLT